MQSDRSVPSCSSQQSPALEPAAYPEESVFLTGPTGSGKTAVAVELAERLHREIISIDSMAVYRQMNIGTAKPSAEQLARVPHHLVDIADVWTDFTLADFLAAATRAVDQITSRSRLPLFVGGTPLYLKTLLYGADTGPPPNEVIRNELKQLAATQGSQSLHESLAEVDPHAAARIHPNDLKRIIRALEVHRTTGEPISARQTHFQSPPARTAHVFCLNLNRPALYQRINDRVIQMFQSGLVNEVRGLVHQSRPLGRTARQALGYKEVIAHMDGQLTLDDTICLVQRRTRQFAKRQLTWFRSIPQCRWISLNPDTTAAAVAGTIVETVKGHLPANPPCG